MARSPSSEGMRCPAAPLIPAPSIVTVAPQFFAQNRQQHGLLRGIQVLLPLVVGAFHRITRQGAFKACIPLQLAEIRDLAECFSRVLREFLVTYVDEMAVRNRALGCFGRSHQDLPLDPGQRDEGTVVGFPLPPQVVVQRAPPPLLRTLPAAPE